MGMASLATCVWRSCLVMKNVIFRGVHPVWGQIGDMCYDYVRVDNLSDVSAYRTVVKPQHTAM